jgi:cyclopropane fatty-acyl-phospholipid synthase-like methyltransferase
MEKKKDWHTHWFNEDYLKLYVHRNQKEADHQVNFLFQALNLKPGMRLLDFGSGAGRHSYAFARQGLSVTGIDTSKILINEAMKWFHLGKINLDLTFLQADIRHFTSAEKFDVIVSLFTSFGYFDDDSNQEILRKVHDELKVNGQFILDYLHPHEVMRNLVSYEEKIVDGESVIVKKNIEGDCVVKTIIFPENTYYECIKLYSRKVLEEMLAKNGLEVIEVWNDYEGKDWRQQGDRQIFRCRRSAF